MRVYFMADDCLFCPPTTKAVEQFNRDNPYNEIKVVDVESAEFKMYEDMLFNIQERTGKPFGTPTVIFDGVLVIGNFNWRSILTFFSTLNNMGVDYNENN